MTLAVPSDGTVGRGGSLDGEMAVVIASSLDKDIAGAPLFRAVSFKLERGDRMTLAGRNGAGKTTLLRMLSGQTSVDRGELAFEKGTRVALHDQRPPLESDIGSHRAEPGVRPRRDLTLRDYVLAGCGDLVALEERLRALEAEMADRPDDAQVLERYAAAQARLEHAGGWNWRARAMTPLHGLGFGDDELDRVLTTFSGGELTRASLARSLAGDPDLLLLDEPTNHLDIASLEWLEGYLAGLDAAVILVAHDRWFLEAVGTSVLELEAGRARFFPGAWHAWRRELAAREIALGKAIEKQQREIARMERFVERFRYKATKARQAQSRVKRLEKMERIERDPADTRTLGFSFGKAERTGRVVLELEDGRLEVPGRTLLGDGELWLERGEHVSLVGPNGVGKTTLIEALAGRRALDGGRLRTGHNVNIGYLTQHAGELGTRGTALEAAQRATGLTPGKARALLGRFLFSGEEAEKPLAGLSGGERRRLSLAVLVASGANVLILDEPTNHLDLDAREALEDALQDFDGAVLLVSHDRALLDAVGSRTIAFEDGRLRSYDGGWAEYARVREERLEAEATRRRARHAGNGTGGSNAAGRPVRSGPSKNAIRRIAELEGEIERSEAALAALEDELADPAMWSSPSRRERSAARHTAAKRAVEEAYARWEQASPS
jgi:ATP-binding cassette, subfamily F, member 3